MKTFCLVLLTLLFIACRSEALPPGERDGELSQQADGVLLAWDSEGGEWVKPEAFWERYAARRGGLTWGKRDDYPPYAEVDELDTMIIELESGPCLMEFFHSRWRRANS